MTDFTKPETRGVWSAASLKVLQERYLQKDADGEICETPDEMCWRVALAIAKAEEKWGCNLSEVQKLAEEFCDMMIKHQFLPNSPTLMNAGSGDGLQYSACYVLPVPDSIEGIFNAVKYAALIHKSGGGTGFSFSQLRPAGSRVRSSGGVASGPVSFMRVFDAATEQIKQGGRQRGANMGILCVDHPDILEFIDCKLTGGITNFNISVAATDEFMQALAEGCEYKLIAPHTGEAVGSLRAQEVFDRIVAAAWQTGDPGLFFIDRCNAGSANPTPALALVEATNPCGEQPLYANEACNLGSINLIQFVKIGQDWPATSPNEAVDWDKLERVVRLAVRFLDDVIEVNPYPLPEIAETVFSNRRIGLGIMGWADLLFALGIPYDSEEALTLADEVMGFINRIGHEESARLAKERGAFPNFAQSIYADDEPLRNATVTTIAPTGSLSIIASCSSGVEPVFALAFRHVAGERQLTLVNPVFEQVVKEQGFYTEELMIKVAQIGRVRGLEGVPEQAQRVFVTAHEIEPSWHVRMQAAFQKHTDNAVSKTVNLSNTATVKDVAQVFLQAYKEGCLGVTVFRDGCKKEQVLHMGTIETALETEGPIMKPRPHAVPGITYRQKTPLGTAFITVTDNGETGQPLEVFVNVGKAGSDTMAVAEGYGRLLSLILRLLSPLSPRDRVVEIVGQLGGIGGGRRVGFGPNSILSLPDAIAQVLAEHISLQGDKEVTTIVFSDGELPHGEFCSNCGMATLIREEGCNKCYNCGYSDCS